MLTHDIGVICIDGIHSIICGDWEETMDLNPIMIRVPRKSMDVDSCVDPDSQDLMKFWHNGLSTTCHVLYKRAETIVIELV